MDTSNGRPELVHGATGRSPNIAARGRLGSALRLAEVRLRLPIVLVITAVVIGRWDVLTNYWDRLTHRTPSESIAGDAVSADTEYFCPMDPGVLSDWPGRCGVCNMALVRRKKGEAAILPDGVVARMQLSPYRVQLAGIRTVPAEFRPLNREWVTTAILTRKRDLASADIELPPRLATWVEEGSEIEVTSADLPGRVPLVGRVRSLVREDRDGGEWRSATAIVDKPPDELRGGMIATVRSRAPVAAIEPFRSMPRDPPVLRAGEPRRLYACADHDDSTAIEPGPCPLDRKEREPRELGELERLRWWCPMHPDVTSDRPGAACRSCGGMVLRPRAIAFAPAGQVLAVPQSAVVDTGERKVVYVEGMPGMFDGVEVTLGPRCGDHYPVIRGIEPGQRVAIAGAFLLDAETRLNPSLASGYFGATGGGRAATATAKGRIALKDEPGPDAALKGLSTEDRRLAERQKTCPVTGLALGSMGTPERLVISRRVVFLCCDGCRSKLLAHPAKYLSKLRAP